MQNVVVFGAGGSIGSHVVAALKATGYQTTTVSRRPTGKNLALDFRSPELRQALANAYAVINLAGAPIIGKRLTAAYRQEIEDSRSGLTARLVACMAELADRPQVLINASATGYYGTHEITDALFDESSPAGSGFWAELCTSWEAAATPAESLGIRTVLIRTGLVLTEDSHGTLAKLAIPFRLFVGGPIGVRESWRSWIHIDDEVGIIMQALSDPNIRGAVNATAPEPLRNDQLAAQLGHFLHRPDWFPVPEFIVRLAFAEVGEVITRGKRIVPTSALQSGYRFEYPSFQSALADLL